jgi:hypothetical protein
MASDWGLYYTSHHYDTLLSDPYHFSRGLAEKRGIKPVWDWQTNREGLIRFWQGGVDENKDLNCIWPVGMRGTDDYPFRFPEGWTPDQKTQAYSDAIRMQTDMVKKAVPPSRERLFHFTMYTEMLPFYQSGQLKVPDDVIIVWPDDNDGNMRGLPAPDDRHKHGVYYHLAYYGANITKQTHQTVPLERVDREFQKILTARANEYVLVNVSELREYVMGARFIADIEWNGAVGFAQPDAAGRYLRWWSREQFGPAAEASVAEAYRGYFALMERADSLNLGASKSLGALGSLEKKFKGERFDPALPETLPTLKARAVKQAKLLEALDAARTQIVDEEHRKFFFDNLELPSAIDRLNTEAAILLVEAMAQPDREKALEMCRRALVSLDELEQHLRRAERWPFEGWYGPSWIGPRHRDVYQPRQTLIRLLASQKTR